MLLNLSQFHLVPEISHLDRDFNVDLLDALLSEAVNRGASDFELLKLMSEYERDHMISSGLGNGTRGSSWSINPRLPLGFFQATMISNVVHAYKAQVDAEYRSLPETARAAFGSPHHYFETRPSYYQYGYNTPFETIFSKIDSFTFLGKEVVGGVHKELRTRLTEVERTLNEWSQRSPGLTSRVAKEIKSIGGFKHRFIAPKEGKKQQSPTLSNHAFGLAIDIDSSRNPHIKDSSVIDVLKQVTGYDFGKYFVPGGSGFDTKDIAIEEWNKARHASDRLQEWLRTYLPIAEANPSSDPQRDRDTEVAVERIGILLKYIPLEGKHPWDDSLKSWATHGILSIPPLLVAAMVGNGVGWGGEWEHSKDLMHFELRPKDVLKPDHPHRSVQDLLRNPVADAMKAGQKKRHALHK
jgi:D-alanyl-D-alanine carboxypeptidase